MPKHVSHPPISEFQKHLSYDPDTGVFTWLVTRGRARKGCRAGWIQDSGYRCIKLLGVETTSARFAWFLTYGNFPEVEVEYINGVVGDDRISNLRLAVVCADLPPLVAERLRAIVGYDPNTGIFTFLSGRRMGKSTRGYKSERRYKISIEGREYMAHRIAWLHSRGVWPELDIDHINGDPFDNRLSNLRPATNHQNLANMAKPITNKSGYKGVSWHQEGKKWQASIRHEGKSVYLGLHSTLEEAHEAYCSAATRLKGEFARFG